MNLSREAPQSQVLVLDDDPNVRRAVSRTLRQAGHDTVLLGSCRAALELERDVDVAVLDLELEDGSGVDVALELLASHRAQAIVFFTGASDPELLARAGRVGPVLVKGQSPSDLVQAVAISLSGPASRLRGRVVTRTAASRR
jgi:DNA-binding response OmpR family regulator